jgi:hypothetical protein
MRWATRLLLFGHIRARTKHLGVFLQYIEFSKWADGETPTAEIQNNEKLASVIASRLDFVLKSSVEIKSIIIVAPVIAGLNAVAQTLGLDLPRFLLKATLGPPENVELTTISGWMGAPEALGWVIAAGSLLAALLWATAGSAVRKREIMIRQKVYELEERLFGSRGIPRPREVPYDTLGYAVGLVLFVSLTVWGLPASELRTDFELMGYVVPGLIYVVPLLYATSRRLSIGRY